jgi:hypothetical protein
MIQNECTFEKIKEFYEMLFAPSDTSIRFGKSFSERKECMKFCMVLYRKYF